jgi:uncharacterized cupin superfamily protein
MKAFGIVEKPGADKLKELEVSGWPVWIKGPSEFVKRYEMPETCYIVEGEAVLTPENGEGVSIRRGMLVYFPAECNCHWSIKTKFSMRYLLG